MKTSSKNTGKTENKYWTAGELEHLISKKYAAPEYAMLAQVRNGTGFQRSVRTADAIAMSLFPSRGIYLTGFEIKVSKTDFKNELKNPKKAEDIAQYCNFWFIVAPSTDIVPLYELPPAWGLLTVDKGGDKLKMSAPAKFKEAMPLDNLMVASIFRNIESAMVPKKSLNKWREDKEKELREKYEAESQSRRNYVEREYKELKGMVAKLEAITGESLKTWNVSSYEKALKLAYQIEHNLEGVANTLSNVSQIAERVRPALNELRKMIYEKKNP